MGNTFLRWEGLEPELPAVATGSHIDAIPHAGMYDGTVGVLGGLEAMRALKRSGSGFGAAIELLLFTSEEPTRFGIGCLGSRLLSGALDAAARGRAARPARGGIDGDAGERAGGGWIHGRRWKRYGCGRGIIMRGWSCISSRGRCWSAKGCGSASLQISLRRRAIAFMIEGLGGHAGALLMPDRRDALCAAAEVILSIEGYALAANAASGTADTVATVGTCAVFPGAVNSVPSRVRWGRYTRYRSRSPRDGDARGAA